MKRLFVAFCGLQAADAATTLCFLSAGMPEGNPLVRCCLSAGPVFGLLAAKVAAVAIAYGVYRFGYRSALRWGTVAFSGVVAWNLFGLAVQAFNEAI